MIIFKHAKNLLAHLLTLKAKGHSVGFVPTMGALHQGHLSLVRQSRTTCALTVCSIFVNPTQFNDPKDFEKYPVTIENDILLLEQAGTDILFLPPVAEIYPGGLTSPIHYNLGYLESILEGVYRPGHFQGVCQVVHNLLKIVTPDYIFLGQKDYQQCMVIQKLIHEFSLPVVLKAGDTLREADGLAMSSRNLRLTEAGRQKATAIYGALSYIKKNIATTGIRQLKQDAMQIIVDAGFDKIDYVEICDAGTLLPIETVGSQVNLVALAAAFIDGVRLIDNLIFAETGR